jgi:hypothetical protein
VRTSLARKLEPSNSAWALPDWLLFRGAEVGQGRPWSRASVTVLTHPRAPAECGTQWRNRSEGKRVLSPRRRNLPRRRGPANRTALRPFRRSRGCKTGRNPASRAGSWIVSRRPSWIQSSCEFQRRAGGTWPPPAHLSSLASPRVRCDNPLVLLPRNRLHAQRWTGMLKL